MREILRFGAFELNPATGELRKSGKSINLPPQPAKVLVFLANHPGELLTRGQIQQEIWGTNTFVDFEKGLNFAIKKIREALGDDAGTPRYIETLHRRGYRFVAPVEQMIAPPLSTRYSVGHSEAPRQDPTNSPINDGHSKASSSGSIGPALALVRGAEPAEVQSTPQPELRVPTDKPRIEVLLSQRPRTTRLAWLMWAAVCIAGVVSAAIIWLASSRAVLPGKMILIVLPLDNATGDPDQESFNEALAEQLRAQISRLDSQRLEVIGSATASRYSGKTREQIEQGLHAQLAVDGSVWRKGSNFRIRMRLIRIQRQGPVWAGEYERSPAGTHTMERDVIAAIAGEIHVKPAPEPPPVDLEASEAYMKGCYLLKKRTKASFSKAIEFFQLALNKNPNYALAYAGLADSHNLMGVYGYSRPDEAYPVAKAEAEQAIKTDGSLAEAYTTLADIKTNYDWDWQGAEADFRHAIKLAPYYETAHLWYGEDYLTRLGRREEAIAEVKLAQQIDPESPIISSILSEMYYFARQFDQAIKEARKALDLEPDFVPALERLGWAYEQKKMYPEAIEAFEHWRKISKDDPEMKAQLAHVYALFGRRADALALLAELEDESRPGHVSPYFIAVVYTALGDKKRALDWLEKSWQLREMPPINVEPRFDSLRSEPRFQDLLRRVHLPS